MGHIFVYEPWPAAVDTMGLCGPLTPGKAKCMQEKNGDFRLDIEHPIDAAGKWRQLSPGNLVKADVPLQTPQNIVGWSSDVPYDAIKRCVVRSDATLANRGVYTLSADGIRLDTLPVGTVVYGSATAGARRKIRWSGGWGYIASAAIDADAETITLMNPADIENYVPSPPSRPQLFRICSTDLTLTGIKVVARHVFYDALSSFVTIAAGTYTCADVFWRPLYFANGPLQYEVTTAFSSSQELPGWTRSGRCEAILSPSDGIASRWNGELLRDNWNVSLVANAGRDRGFAIAYGSNMLGVTYTTDNDQIISEILPIGQTSKGKPLVVPDGVYTVDGAFVTVVNNAAARSGAPGYPVPHASVVDFGADIKAAGTTSTQLNAAYIKLLRAAMKKLTDEQCDLPQVTLTVDFIRLGDTAEYARYRDLQKVFLFDTVRVQHPWMGIEVTTKVNKVTWDCLTNRYDSVELGSIRKSYARSRLATWQVPGLTSLQSYVNTIAGLV